MKSTQDKAKIENHSRVILLEGEFGPGMNNPSQGSRYACEGTVVYVATNGTGDTLLPIKVKWDNGLTNSYGHKHLMQLEDTKDNPNSSFKLKKGREDSKRFDATSYSFKFE